MDILYNLLILLIGFVLLCAGSNWLIKGAGDIAYSFSIRPVIVGLTVVAFATSAPEFLVSFIAAIKGSSGVSIGNIIGSNILNIAFGIGLISLIKPLEINKKGLKVEAFFMIISAFVFWLVSWDGFISRLDSVIFLIFLIIFLAYGIIFAKEDEKIYKIKQQNVNYLLSGFLAIIGIAALIFGANLIVKSAIFIARLAGFSEVFIGISIVALGTSLPEIATSVIAALKNESEMSIGNIIGSNILNICLILGLIILFCPMKISVELNKFEFPSMIFFSLLLFIFCIRSKKQIGRLAGFIISASFVIYFTILYNFFSA
jgi:cation:H+ antiporter